MITYRANARGRAAYSRISKFKCDFRVPDVANIVSILDPTPLAATPFVFLQTVVISEKTRNEYTILYFYTLAILFKFSTRSFHSFETHGGIFLISNRGGITRSGNAFRVAFKNAFILQCSSRHPLPFLGVSIIYFTLQPYPLLLTIFFYSEFFYRPHWRD